MKIVKIFKILIGIIFLHYSLIAQINLHGFVSDALTKERLIGANIRIEGTSRGTITNNYGFFSLPDINSSGIKIKISYLGYVTKIIELKEIENKPINIFLKPTDIKVEEIVVEADRHHDHISSTSIGNISIPIMQIQTLPSVGGEVDLLKAVQLQSGVSSGNELSNGIYVRGGSFDQNLILLDGVTIYNPNHLWGFLSIFNTDAVKNVELIKGGIPAEYGGRLSSVLSFTLKDGNLEKTTWQGGVSTISSRLSVEGPFSKNGSYLISLRRSYFDLPLFFLNSEYKEYENKAYFYDFIAKANYTISNSDRFYLSGYFGKDAFTSKYTYSDLSDIDIGFSWGNQAYNLRWNHLWSSDFFSNVALVYSDYYSLQKEFNYRSSMIFIKEPSVKDFSLKADGEYFINENHSLKFGTAFINHRFRATAGLFENSNEIALINVNEIQNYISHDWKITERLQITEGIRYDYFSTIKKGEIDPRINLRYLINDDLSLKVSYTKMYQFTHLLSTSIIMLPGDIYYPSTQFLMPENSQQISAGIFSSLSFLKLPEIETSLEIFYKDMKNLPMFRHRFSSPSDENIKQDVVIGKGWAYGIDLQLNKNYGAFTGWLSYSYLFTRRQYEEKNGGRAFSPKFERPHQLNIVINSSLSDDWLIGATFILASGQPFTIPRQVYYVEDFRIINYGDIYSFRLPTYNRMDLSFTRRWESWGVKFETFLNLYNVYNYPAPLLAWYGSSFSRTGNHLVTFSVGFFPTIGVNFKF